MGTKNKKLKLKKASDTGNNDATLRRVQYIKINPRGGVLLHVKGAGGFRNTELLQCGRLIRKDEAPQELLEIADNKQHTIIDSETRRRYYKAETVERIEDTSTNDIALLPDDIITTEKGSTADVHRTDVKTRGNSGPEAAMLRALKSKAGLDD